MLFPSSSGSAVYGLRGGERLQYFVREIQVIIYSRLSVGRPFRTSHGILLCENLLNWRVLRRYRGKALIGRV